MTARRRAAARSLKDFAPPPPRRRVADAASVDAIVDRIYHLATKLDGITEATQLLARETRSRSCGLMIQSHAGFTVHGGWLWGMDQVWGLAYRTRYYACDPTVAEHFGIGPDRAYASPLDRDNASFRRSEFFTQWCAPQRLGYFAGIYRLLEPPMALRLTLQGDFERGPYEPEVLALMEAVLPHLRRAVDINHEVTQLLGHTRAFSAMLEESRNAIVLLNLAGTVIHANAAAEAMVGQGFAIRERRFRPLDPAAREQIDAAILACTAALSLSPAPVMQAGCHVSIPRRGALPLSVFVSPVRLAGASPHDPLPPDLVRLQIVDPDHEVRLDAEGLRKVMGLTAAESRVASRLCRGDTAQEIADALGLSAHTVRDHVKHIYQRIGVTKQSEFVARAYSVLRLQRTGEEGAARDA